MNREQREIALWAGSALVAGICVAVWLWVLRLPAVQQSEAEVARLHERYRELYLAEGPGRQPADRALAAARGLVDQQAEALAYLEERLLWPGRGSAAVPEEISPDHIYGRVLADGGRDGRLDGATAADLVGRVNARLRSRAQSQGVPIPASLPFSGGLAADEDARRALQLAQVVAYAAACDLAMDAGVLAIEAVNPAATWLDASGHYLGVETELRLRATYVSADQFTRSLAAHRGGLGLDAIALELREDGNLDLTVTVLLLLPPREDWSLAERPAAAGRVAPAEGATTRGTRGATGGSR